MGLHQSDSQPEQLLGIPLYSILLLHHKRLSSLVPSSTIVQSGSEIYECPFPVLRDYHEFQRRHSSFQLARGNSRHQLVDTWKKGVSTGRGISSGQGIVAVRIEITLPFLFAAMGTFFISAGLGSSLASMGGSCLLSFICLSRRYILISLFQLLIFSIPFYLLVLQYLETMACLICYQGQINNHFRVFIIFFSRCFHGLRHGSTGFCNSQLSIGKSIPERLSGSSLPSNHKGAGVWRVRYEVKVNRVPNSVEAR